MCQYNMVRLRPQASAALLCLLTFCLTPSVYAQFSFPIAGLSNPAAASAAPTSTSASAAGGTSSSSSTGLFAPASHAAVMLNNQILFQVYGSSARSAQDRADLASLRLTDALNDLPHDAIAQPPRVTVSASKATDANPSDTIIEIKGEPLLTVTDADAANYHEDTLVLADTWSRQISAALTQAVRERTPGYLKHAAYQAGIIVAAGALIQLLIVFFAFRFKASAGWPGQVLLWDVVARWVFYLFPQTRPIDTFLMFGPAKLLTILIDVGLAAAVLARIWRSVLRRLFPPVPENLSHEEWGRRSILRRATLASIARVTGASVIWFVAAVAALGWMGVNLSALLTSAGLLGVAIGLATQDSMKDLVAGVNILADDRFGVGDTIQVSDYEGRVEKLDLRITQIRDLSGRLITIPNRNITQVANLTSRWAQVDLRIGVSYYDDLERAMNVMTETAQKMADERPEAITASPQMLGVDSFNDTNITLRMLLRTNPGDQWRVARELRARIKLEFDSAGIALLNALHTTPAPTEPTEPAASEPPKNGVSSPAEQK